MQYLCLATTIKDDEYYIKEWLTFYDIVGVERFYIVLHNTTDNTLQRINELPFRNRITIHEVQTSDSWNHQIGIYNWLLSCYKKNTKWMLFVDGDEFLFGTEKNDLKTLLEPYEAYPGVLVPRLDFGPSGFDVRPEMPSVKHYRMRMPEKNIVYSSDIVKTIVQPDLTHYAISSHLFWSEQEVVNERFEKYLIPHGYKKFHIDDYNPSFDTFRVNHYYTRSFEDWQQRLKRGANTPWVQKNRYNNNSYQLVQYLATVEDLTIQRFVPELECRLSE